MLMPIAKNFPVGIRVFADASIQIVPLQGILNGAVIDQYSDKEGVSGFFDQEGFILKKGLDEPMKFEYDINYPYKTMEVLLEWLKQQNMMLPN